MLPTPSAFYFLDPSALKHWTDIISGSFYPEKHWHMHSRTTKLLGSIQRRKKVLFLVKSLLAHFFYRIVSHFGQSLALFVEKLSIICLACIYILFTPCAMFESINYF